jgi:hypothetical protein
MNRRSFLQSILAAGVAPWVMSNGVAGGILMPVRRVVVPPSAPAFLKIYSGSPKIPGPLLARLELNALDVGFRNRLATNGHGEVICSGLANWARLEDRYKRLIMTATVGVPLSGCDLILTNESLSVGQNISLRMDLIKP